jgi:xylulokinase
MWLGIDIGTSAVKAVIVDEHGRNVATASQPLNVSRPHPGWSEQSPDEWWAATAAAVQSLDARARMGVLAIGLAGQMHGAVLLDAADRPLRPAILWNDGRAAAACAELERLEPRTREITGNAAMPGFTAPKLLWARRHEPEIAAQTRTVLLPKDYVRLCMTGVHATDASDASGTLWLDVAARAWSPAMLSACGLDERNMPSVHEGTHVTGRLRAEVANSWGMATVPVVAGGSDNAAGAVGAGVIQPGQAFLSLGTSGVLFVADNRFRPAPARGAHAFCHALPGRWHQMAVILSAAAALEWAARACRFPSVAAALEAAGEAVPFGGPELFAPYLSGERTPHNDVDVRGAWLGLDHDSDPGRLVLSVLEGVAFALAEGQDVLVEAGALIADVSVIGGGARSPLWGRVLAAALDRPLCYRDDGQVGPAFGAARLARLAGGETVEQVCSPPPLDYVAELDPALAQRAREKRERFSRLYRALKDSR